MIKKLPVDSTNIEQAGYDPLTGQLFVDFKNGSYVYHGVTLDQYNTFLEAPSKGHYLAKNIKHACVAEKV
jgi:hypothetical protein